MVCSEQELIIKSWLLKRAVSLTAQRKNICSLLRFAFRLVRCTFAISPIDERVKEQDSYASSTLL